MLDNTSSLLDNMVEKANKKGFLFFYLNEMVENSGIVLTYQAILMLLSKDVG